MDRRVIALSNQNKDEHWTFPFVANTMKKSNLLISPQASAWNVVRARKNKWLRKEYAREQSLAPYVLV